METSNIVLTKVLNKYTSIDFFKDIINVCLYPSDFSITVGVNEQDSVPNFFRTFFNNLQKTVIRYNHPEKQNALKFIESTNSILMIRNQGQGLLTYDTINQHFTAPNAIIKKLIDSAISERITDDNTFRQKINNIILNINYYFDFQRALASMTEVHEFLDKIDKPETSIIEVVEKFKCMALQLNSDLSQLSTVNHNENSVDYYMMDSDESITDISNSIVDNILNNYSIYKCGLSAYDNSVAGFEASSVHIVASPSNGGKSMTLANLFWRIAMNNKDDFTESDAALFITCEDDIIKTTRKFMSIFGNFDYQIIRDIYKDIHGLFTEIKKGNNNEHLEYCKDAAVEIFKDVLNESIVKTTKGNLKIIFKYSPENTLSCGDITRQIEIYKHQGINIKYLIVDYLDVLKPTLITSNIDDYTKLGIITQEARTLSRLYGIPVITASQTTRGGDDIQRSMTNTIMGDSWKKVQYSDFIYMQRIRNDLTIESDAVSKYVFDEKFKNYNSVDSPEVQLMLDELNQYLKPLEMHVTKSKERGKGYSSFMLFCTKNLRIYNNVSEYMDDMNEFNKINPILKMKIKNTLDLSRINNIVETEILNIEDLGE